ncbi:A24 family peptidase [Adlercreutzia sp. R7]|uniref:A24 family peptidase n=1 Tax=Adlercreutzia wanghongyangiae TaxID=3111451 RepID=A0ABU6IFI4_9ACTN|nr:A24 family peptidase [Adlercreutzia sp. R7]
MTYVSVVTLVAYGLLLAGLVVIAVGDMRTRRIPNGMVAALALLWVIWRCVLGFAGRYMGLGFWNTLLSPAPTVLGQIGLPVYGASLSGGVLGALALGGGMLVLSAVYELTTKKESFGGGDIKLMVVIGLFLGWERGLVCLFVACLVSVIYALVMRFRTRGKDGDTARPAEGSQSAPAAAGTQASSEVADPFLARTMPFAPFLAVGTLVAFFF